MCNERLTANLNFDTESETQSSSRAENYIGHLYRGNDCETGSQIKEDNSLNGKKPCFSCP